MLLSCIPLLASLAAGAADLTLSDLRARESGVFTVYLENDTFGGRDQHYTNGLKLSWLSADLTEWGREGWQQSVLEWLPFVNRTGGHKNIGVSFGQNIYTPQDISRNPPDPNDRPYAGWSYLEFMFVSKTSSMMDTLSLQVGIVGRRSYAQDLQTVVHEWLNSERPAGWDHQLGHEIGIDIVFERKWRAQGRLTGTPLGADLVPHAGVSLGNVQTYANAGATLRVGVNLASDFAVGPIRAAAAPNTPLEDTDPRLAGNAAWSVFVFGGVDGRAVARDLFLDGNTFHESPSVDKEPWVADLYYGAGAAYGKWQLTFTQVVRSREFSTQVTRSRYGSISISRTL